MTADDAVPQPVVLIDQDSDRDATIVQLSFGDRLGALLDTVCILLCRGCPFFGLALLRYALMIYKLQIFCIYKLLRRGVHCLQMKALKDLGLDVTKGSVATDSSVTQTKFHIMRLGRKVEDPDMLETIRLTIINNLLQYHPESSEKLAMGEFFGIKAPEKKVDVDVATHVIVQDDGPKRSMLYIETADRPGLLLEVIKIITDVNVDVESAEIDTEGLVAKDKFHVSYRGAKLNSSLSQVLVNCLRYYLRRPETDEDSY
uniref:ACT domain-containing protein ACR n=1 Tax=Aegilops tauschii subsp. strangulata TaxID=200361 RepID=A0A453K9Q1_AEGTS